MLALAMAEFRYPNESDEYRAARKELLRREVALRAETEAVAKLRRELPLGGAVTDQYRFTQVGEDGEIHEVPLVELFGAHDQLLIYTMMFGPDWDAPCPSCTSIVDAIDANAYQVEETCGLAVVAAARPEQCHAWAQQRGWNTVRLLSGTASSYLVDYASFPDADDPAMVSAMNAFVRTPDGVFHTWGSEMSNVPMDNGHPRHVDAIWPLWNMLDMAPHGRGDASAPRHTYEHALLRRARDGGQRDLKISARWRHRSGWVVLSI